MISEGFQKEATWIQRYEKVLTWTLEISLVKIVFDTESSYDQALSLHCFQTLLMILM